MHSLISSQSPQCNPGNFVNWEAAAVLVLRKFFNHKNKVCDVFMQKVLCVESSRKWPNGWLPWNERISLHSKLFIIWIIWTDGQKIMISHENVDLWNKTIWYNQRCWTGLILVLGFCKQVSRFSTNIWRMKHMHEVSMAGPKFERKKRQSITWTG